VRRGSHRCAQALQRRRRAHGGRSRDHDRGHARQRRRSADEGASVCALRRAPDRHHRTGAADGRLRAATVCSHRLRIANTCTDIGLRLLLVTRACGADETRPTPPLAGRNETGTSGVRKQRCGSHARRSTSTCTQSASRPDPRFRQRKTLRTALPRKRRTPPAAAQRSQQSARENTCRRAQAAARRARHCTAQCTQPAGATPQPSAARTSDSCSSERRAQTCLAASSSDCACA
jgi:hypothetical protein